MPVENGDIIKLQFKITLEDGTIFDSSDMRGGPIKVQVGTRQVLKSLDESLIGMEVGEEKQLILPPEKAYGEFDPLLLEKIPISQIAQDHNLKIGNQIEVIGPNGMGSPGWIRLIDEDFVIVDMNHPGAGKTLTFTLKVIEKGLDPEPVVNPFIFGCDGACEHHE